MSDDSTTGTKVSFGFVGLGSMGGALVDSLIAAGHHPVVFDIDQARIEDACGRGALAGTSLVDVGQRSNIVGVCVATDDQVDEVFENGLLEGLAPGSLVSLHSTVLPETVTRAAEAARARGVGFVEAPVAGGEDAAREGRVTFMLGGDDAEVDALEPLLAACAGLQVRAGELGKANLLKLCVNLQAYVTLLAVHEAAGLATALDLPLEALKEAMDGNGQLSEMARNYLVMHELPEEMLDDPAVIAIRDPRVAIIAKDLRLMAEIGERIGRELPAATLAAERLDDTYFMPPRRR